MGARSTKQPEKKGERKVFGISQSSKPKSGERRWNIVKRHGFKQKGVRVEDGEHLVRENNNSQGTAVEQTSMTAERRLKKLSVECPPGFKRFNSDVEWQAIDPEIALQLWEDVFKPLYTFHIVSHVLEDYAEQTGF